MTPAVPGHVDWGDGRSPVGLWKFTYVDTDGNLVDYGYNTMNEGGTENDLSFFHPPLGGNVCIGTWRETRARHYKVSHYAPIFSQDHLTNIGLVNRIADITLADDGQSTVGTFVTTGYDNSGNTLFVRQGTTTAIRIKVNTPPFP